MLIQNSNLVEIYIHGITRPVFVDPVLVKVNAKYYQNHLMQDGATSHTTAITQMHLCGKFGQCCIRKDQLLPNSPDIYYNQRTRFENIEELKNGLRRYGKMHTLWIN